MVKREERCADVTELRVQPEGESAVIEGHAAIFDSLSQDLGFMFPFKERINKGAFKSSLEKDDIRALRNHDANYLLGRNKAGTLELTETNKGLRVRIPPVQWARDLTESIRQRRPTQMSWVCGRKETWA